MPDIPQTANTMVPVGDASYRAQEAALEFDRRRGAVTNTGTGGGVASDGAGGGAQVIASRPLMQQIMQALLGSFPDSVGGAF